MNILEYESFSSLEKEAYLCFSELLAWRQLGTSEIPVTTRFANVDSL